MFAKLFTTLLFLSFVEFSSQATEANATNVRPGKALSVFQVVRFPNTACIGSTNNGTCYTASECTNKGGTSAGTCANGFGVCCTFILGCGARIAENCTYFQSSSQAAGQCGVTICKCSTDICQLRLDFNTFVIAGPSTVTLSLGFLLGGSSDVTATANVKYSTATQCLTDTFSVTGVPGGNPPVICGTNTGFHMYADATDSCNTLDFQLGQSGVGNTIPTRQWNIKISQISCNNPNRAPAGCTQYFYSSQSAAATPTPIYSFNYANMIQLANQRQSICVRRVSRLYLKPARDYTIYYRAFLSSRKKTQESYNLKTDQ